MTGNERGLVIHYGVASRGPTARLAVLLLLAVLGCARAASRLTPVGPDQACAGRLVLEFTNRLSGPVHVGWIPLERLQADPGRAEPIWLGVVGQGTARYRVPGPGRVISRNVNPPKDGVDRSYVVHRVLCDPARR